MQAQKVETCVGEDLIAFWDLGSQFTMLTHTQKGGSGGPDARAHPPSTHQGIKGFKSEELLLNTGDHLPLKTKDRHMHTLFAYGIQKIVTDVNSSLDREAAAASPREAVRGMAGHVNMLLGFDNMGCFPVEADRKGLLALWSSQLDTGWTIASRPQPSCSCEGCTCTVTVNTVGAEHFQPLDFIRAKALGTDTPAICAACRNCKECKFRADSICFKENKEYEVIINGLQLDVEKKKWTA
jgi:hypothetical protein